MTDRQSKKRIVNPLSGLSFKRDFREIEESAFEESTVSYLLSAFGTEKLKWQLVRQHEQNTGQKRLTLLDFCNHYDTFPLVLQSLAAEVSKSNKLHVLFKSLPTRTFVKKWFELRGDLPREFQSRPFGLVVKWAHVARGMIMHTLGDRGDDGIRLVWRNQKFEMTVEPMTQFVTWLKSNWSP